MLAIFWRTIKDRKTSLIIYTLISVLFLWMYIALYPSIKSQSDNMMKLMETYPESLKKAFNIDEFDFSRIENYLAMENFSFLWPIMATIFVIAFAGGAVAGEIEKGTVEIILSQPVSRVKIFIGKYMAAFKCLLIFTFISTFAIVPLAKTYGISYSFINLGKISIASFLFGLAIMSIAHFFSTIFSDKGKVYFLSGGILVLMYVLNIIAGLKTNLENLKYLSFFYYYNPTKIFAHGNLETLTLVVFISISIIFTSLGILVFKKRDIAI